MVDDKQHRKAGLARSESMSSSERKSLATKAAHARWKRSPDGVAIATHEGTVELGAFKIPCAVLKDGRRIFSERGLSEALHHVRSGAEFKKRREAPAGEQLPVFLNETVSVYLSEAARERLSTPIRYRHADDFSIPAWGVDAELLPEVCDAYLAAREDGVLVHPAQLRKAAAAEKLLRALAKTGVVALIDEATGFQIERDREELQTLLAKYVSEEFRPWARMFPTQYYVEMFRLRGINTADVRKRPAYFGKLTNSVIYRRLLPGTLEKLRAVNPKDDNGRRSRKHHQHFTDDMGEKHLHDHIMGVLFLMKSATSWDDFIRRLDRAAPLQQETLSLPFPEADDDA